MEEYEVIVEKTVRDLFKSSPLIQIKKYKMTKEREIQSKNDELKKLILDQYPLLINTIDALEEISSHLKELQTIKNQLGMNFKSLDFEEIEIKLSNVNFDENIFREDEIEESYDMEAQFNKGYLLLNEKKYNDIISILIDIKCHCKQLQGFNIDNYEYLKVELIESLMKELINNNTNLIESIDYYNRTFEVIYNELTINNNNKAFLDKLYLSEFYLKISYDDNITAIINKYFSANNSNSENKNNSKDIGQSDSMFGSNLIIRLLILKLSQCFVLLSKSKDNEFTKEDNRKSLKELYLALLSIFKTVKAYQTNIDYDKNKNMSDFISFIKGEITNNLSSLFIISKGNSCQYSSTMRLKPVDIITFWISIYEEMVQLNKDNEELLSSYNILGDNRSLIEVLFDSKVIDQISNLIQYKTYQYSFESFSSNRPIDNHISKSNSIIANIKTKGFNSKKEQELKTLFQTISSISMSIPQFASITKTIIQILFNHLKDILTKALTIFNKGNEMNDIANAYLEFLMNKFSHSELINICNEFELKQLVELISSIEEIYLKTNYSKIKEFMGIFETYLFHETFSSQDSSSDSSVYTCSDSLKELILFLQSIEINQSQYKKMILNLVYSSYEKQIAIFIQDNILNPKITVDLNLLSRIKISVSLIDNSDDIEQKDFEALITSLENKFNFTNAYDDTIEIVGKKELNNFFYNDNYSQENICFPIPINKLHLELKKEKKELINCGTYHSKLNVYFIDKTIGSSISNQKKKSVIQGNSTSKILEHRIDENYLSLKTNKPNLGPSNSNNTIQSQNSNSFLTEKFFNLKN